MKKAFWGLRAVLLAALFFFCASTADAQAWRKDGRFTEGAKIALHRVWGTHMGYANPAETAAAADSIFKNSQFFALKVWNSGVTPAGVIRPLPEGVFPVCVLGTADGSSVGANSPTVTLYLKEGCGNLAWVPIVCTPPNNVQISGQSLGGGQVRLMATWTAGVNGGAETVTWTVGSTTVATTATATFTPPAGTTTYTATVWNTCGTASASHQVTVDGVTRVTPPAGTTVTTPPGAVRPTATATPYTTPGGYYAQPAQPITCQPVFWGSGQVPCWRDPVFRVFFSFTFVLNWTKCRSQRHGCDYWCPAPPPPTWSCPAPPPPGRVPVVLDHGDGDGNTGDPIVDSGDGDGNGSGETGDPWDPTAGDGTGDTGDPWPGGDNGGGDLAAPIAPVTFEPPAQGAYQLVDRAGGLSPNPPVGMRRVNPDGTPGRMADYAPVGISPNPAYQPFPQGTARGNFPTTSPGASWGNQGTGTYQGARTHGTQIIPGAAPTGTVRQHGTTLQPGGPPPPGRPIRLESPPGG